MPGVFLARAGAAGSDRRPRRIRQPRRNRSVLPLAARRVAGWRVGVEAKQRIAVARRARKTRRRTVRAIRRQRNPGAGFLGWLSRRPAGDRILAGTAQPAARPVAIQPRRRWVEDRTTVAVSSVAPSPTYSWERAGAGGGGGGGGDFGRRTIIEFVNHPHPSPLP